MGSGWAKVTSLLGWTPAPWRFERLGDTPQVHVSRYAGFVGSTIPLGEWELVRSALHRGLLTSDERFIDEVEAIIGQRTENRQQGRWHVDAGK